MGFSQYTSLPASQGVDYHLFVPVIRDGHDDGIDILGFEQLFVSARGPDGLSDNFLRKFMAAVVQIGCGNALHTAKLDGGCQQTRTFHPHAKRFRNGRDRSARPPAPRMEWARR